MVVGRGLFGLGGVSLLGVLLSLPQGAPMPPPPFELYDIWWEGGAASSCEYYYTEGFKDFFVNCSLTATKEEASMKHNQPRSYSTGSPQKIFTKCHKGSVDCGTKDLCLSAYPTSYPRNHTVKLRGCLENLHIDKLRVEFALSSMLTWRGVVSRGKEGVDVHKICTNPFLWSHPNPSLTRCVKVAGNDVDTDNLLVDFGAQFETSVFYTKLEGGEHRLCSLNATDISTNTPFCNPRGFPSAQRPRLTATSTSLSEEIAMLMDNEICTIPANLTGKWSCAKLAHGQGPVAGLSSKYNFATKKSDLGWAVESKSMDATMQWCNTTSPLGSAPVSCYPFGGPKTPKGTTVSLSHTAPYLEWSGALVRTKEGIVLCVHRGPSFDNRPACTQPLDVPADNLGAVFPWMFQSVDPHTGQLSICNYGFYTRHKGVSCTNLYTPFAKISPFKGWLQGAHP